MTDLLHHPWVDRTYLGVELRGVEDPLGGEYEGWELEGVRGKD